MGLMLNLIHSTRLDKLTDFTQFQKFADSVRAAYGISSDYGPDSDIGKELARVSEILWCYFQLPDDMRIPFQCPILQLFESDDDDTQPEDILDELELIYGASGHVPTPESVREAEVFLNTATESGNEDIHGLEFESLAEFAEPLICCSRVEENPDLIDEMMMRAHDYWHLAIDAKNGRDAKLASIISKYSQNGESPADIRTEATMMIERFDQLYRSNGTRH